MFKTIKNITPNLITLWEEKRAKVLNGELVIMSDIEYDTWIDAGMSTNVVSVFNPDRLGTLDALVVGLIDNPKITELRKQLNLD